MYISRITILEFYTAFHKAKIPIIILGLHILSSPAPLTVRTNFVIIFTEKKEKQMSASNSPSW